MGMNGKKSLVSATSPRVIYRSRYYGQFGRQVTAGYPKQTVINY